MNSTQLWIMLGVNSALFAISAFMVKQWMSSIKENNDNTKNELNDYRTKNDNSISEIKNEIGKRKGETELLRKDLEILSTNTNKNFENIKIHMEYQRTSLDEIKASVAERGAKELQAIFELTKKLNKDGE